MRLAMKIAALTMTTATPAFAQQDLGTGNAMLKHCKAVLADSNTGSRVAKGVCIGNVDAILSLGKILPGASGRGAICAPDGVTRSQALQVVVRYMEKNPQMLQTKFVPLALTALSEAWPCR